MVGRCGATVRDMTSSRPRPVRRLLAALGGLLALSASVLATPSASAAPSALSATPALSAAAAPPAGFVGRTSTYWSWFGPRGWVASYSAYGITVSSPGRTAHRDYGFSSTLCSAASSWPQSAARNFAQRRVQVVRGSGARQFIFRTISPVRQVGTLLFRQDMLFDAYFANGTRVRGKLQFFYGAYDSTYCYQSSDARTAPQASFDRTIGTLDAIARYTTYRGPGAPCTPTEFVTC